MSVTAHSDPAARAGRREWIGLAVLSLPTILLSLDISVLYLALPHLTNDLKANSVQQLWIIDIYSFMTAGFLITMGGLGDRVGRRKLLLIGAATFGASSIVGAYAVNPVELIVARAMIGISAATLLPCAIGLVRHMFKDPHQMGQAMGIFFSCFTGGLALGPLVGGVLLDNFWWGSAFLMGVPVMVVLLIAGPLLLPEYRNEQAGPLDLPSVALALAAILPVVYGIKETARAGWALGPIAAIVLGVAIGTVFISRQRRLDSPLLDLRLFSNLTFSTAMSVTLIAGIIMAGNTLLAALYLQSVKGLSPLVAGLYLVPQQLATVAGSMIGPVLARRFRISALMSAGLVISVAGFAVLTTVDSTVGPYLLAGGLVLIGGGLSLPLVLAGNLVMASAPPEKAGSAAGLMETSGEFGIAVGVAIMGSLGALVYRTSLPDRIPHVPAPAMHRAGESITEAGSAATALGGPAGAALLHQARVAFSTSLNVVAAVGGCIFLAIAVAVPIVLRGEGRPGQEQHSQEAPEPIGAIGEAG